MVGDRAVKAESREREREGTDEKRTLDRDKYLFFFFFSTTRCRFSLWAERGEEKKVWDFFFFLNFQVWDFNCKFATSNPRFKLK